MAEKDPSLRLEQRRAPRKRSGPKPGSSLRLSDRSPFNRPRPTLIERPLLTTREKLMASLSPEVVIRPGFPASRIHPSLPGAEFTEEECMRASSIALSAQMSLLLSFTVDGANKDLSETRALIREKRFWSAAKTCDAGSMMSMALKELLVSARAAEVSDGFSDARPQASEDVSEALLLAEELQNYKDDPENMLPSVRRMANLEKRYPQATPYQLALKAIDVRREGRQFTDPNIRIDISGVVDSGDDVAKGMEGLKEVIESLMAPEKALIEKVLGVEELSRRSLYDFLAMHPGRRDMLLRRGINRQWLSDGWKAGLQLYKDLYRSIYAKCGIATPSAQEKREAAMDPANLSEEQRLCVSFIFPTGPDDRITSAHISYLDIWLRADKDELEQAWKDMYPRWEEIEKLVTEMRTRGISVERLGLLSMLLEKQPFDFSLREMSDPDLVETKIAPLRLARDMWFSPTKEERASIWRYNSSDLYATASLSHRLRYGGRNAGFTKDEDRIGSIIFPGLDSMATLDGSAKEVAADMFKKPYSGRSGRKNYHQPIIGLAKLPGMEVSSLRKAAYREAEFKTLIEFLGIQRPVLEAQAVGNMWTSQAKTQNGDPSRSFNEDSCSSIEVSSGEDVLRLDMVADGMGGHRKGDSSFSETNGQTASRIAKEVFEICAIAGWITTPEEARQTIVMADLAITREQIARKENEDRSVENDMGCTMSILLQRNDDLWGIHAGDSDWKVMREGKPAILGIGHTGEWGALQDVRREAERLVRMEAMMKETETGDVEEQFMKSPPRSIERQTEDMTHELYTQRIEQGVIRKGGVSSALGHGAEYIHINNRESGHKPFKVKADDMLILCSDGVGVPICNHEFTLFAERAGWDLAKARDEIVKEAAGRVGRHEGVLLEHTTICECAVRPGKPSSDDATLMMRYATGALKPLVKRESEQKNPGSKEAKAASQQPAAPFSDAPPSYEKIIEYPEEPKPAVPLAKERGSKSQQEQPAQNEGSGLLRLLRRGPKRTKPLEKTTDNGKSGYKPKTIFNSQYALDGTELPEDATRWFDRTVRSMHGSDIVQFVARELGILPRDLEIMTFFAYCSDMEMAKDPRHTPEGWEFIGMIPMHLVTADAERILRASYLIYMLKEHDWDAKDRQGMLKELRGHLSSMQFGAEHTQRLEMAAFGIQGSGKDPEGRRSRHPRGGMV